MRSTRNEKLAKALRAYKKDKRKDKRKKCDQTAEMLDDKNATNPPKATTTTTTTATMTLPTKTTDAPADGIAKAGDRRARKPSGPSGESGAKIVAKDCATCHMPRREDDLAGVSVIARCGGYGPSRRSLNRSASKRREMRDFALRANFTEKVRVAGYGTVELTKLAGEGSSRDVRD